MGYDQKHFCHGRGRGFNFAVLCMDAAHFWLICGAAGFQSSDRKRCFTPDQPGRGHLRRKTPTTFRLLAEGRSEIH
jgi:hypothetical protein